MGKNLPILIVGSSDPWVREITDAIIASGRKFEKLEIEAEDLENPDWKPRTVQIEAPGQTPVFTGSYQDSRLSHDNFPRRVLLPFKRLVDWQISKGLTNWVNVVHPMAWASTSSVLLGDVFVGANSSIGANCSIGGHVRINRNVSVGHDVRIGEGVEIAPTSAISSGVSVGEWAFIGAGAVILNEIQIGAGSIVGAGAVVTKNVPKNSLVLGSPGQIRPLPD